MKRNYNISSFLLLQLAIGLYFCLKGLLGIIGFNSGVVEQAVNEFNKLMGNNNYLPLIISLCFLLAGLALLSGVIFGFRHRVIFFVVLILWIVNIVVNYFINNLLQPELLVWLKNLSFELIILAGLWSITQKR